MNVGFFIGLLAAAALTLFIVLTTGVGGEWAFAIGVVLGFACTAIGASLDA